MISIPSYAQVETFMRLNLMFNDIISASNETIFNGICIVKGITFRGKHRTLEVSGIIKPGCFKRYE